MENDPALVKREIEFDLFIKFIEISFLPNNKNLQNISNYLINKKFKCISLCILYVHAGYLCIYCY